jgi:Fe-Mn family superoxide dismutase
MAFKLPALPFSPDALGSSMSAETFSYHHGKHHKAYIDKLNELLPESGMKDSSLEEIVRKAAKGPLFNNAAQAWNHTFFWHCLTPTAGAPTGGLEKAMKAAFGDLAGFHDKFSKSAIGNFGSGWTWLVKDSAGALSIVNTSNAETPITGDKIPVMVVDVWEHAYYVDHRNARPKFLEAFQKITNWKFASERYEAAQVYDATKEMRA